MADEKNVTKAPAGRVKRTPVGQRGRLPFIKTEAGYEYRIVNDQEDRIEQFEEAGWEMLPKEVLKASARRMNDPTAEGSKAQLGVGQGQKAFVMRIRKEWYDEDFAAKQAVVQQSEDAMRAKALNDGLNHGSGIKLTRE